MFLVDRDSSIDAHAAASTGVVECSNRGRTGKGRTGRAPAWTCRGRRRARINPIPELPEDSEHLVMPNARFKGCLDDHIRCLVPGIIGGGVVESATCAGGAQQAIIGKAMAHENGLRLLNGGTQ